MQLIERKKFTAHEIRLVISTLYSFEGSPASAEGRIVVIEFAGGSIHRIISHQLSLPPTNSLIYPSNLSEASWNYISKVCLLI